jgi:hypothetical protein
LSRDAAFWAAAFKAKGCRYFTPTAAPLWRNQVHLDIDFAARPQPPSVVTLSVWGMISTER